MKKEKVIGIDIGGTKIAGIICDLRGKKIDFLQITTEAYKGKAHVIDRTIALIAQLSGKIPTSHIKAIGIGVPGQVLKNKGIVVNPPNLPGFKRVNLKKIIEKRTRIKTYIENDANAAGLGEAKYGAGKGYSNMLYVTISTGIGGGIILDGKIYHGTDGAAGEIGHTNTGRTELTCPCGRVGCLEAYASGKGMIKLSKLILGKTYDSITLQKMASQGNKNAIKVINEAAKLIGIAFANYANLINPEVIIIGGGVAKMGNILLNPIRKYLKIYAQDVCAARVKVIPAKLGDKIGAFGAASLCI
ncbi:MAG: ROK family protein [bacterium]